MLYNSKNQHKAKTVERCLIDKILLIKFSQVKSHAIEIISIYKLMNNQYVYIALKNIVKIRNKLIFQIKYRDLLIIRQKTIEYKNVIS